MANLYLSPVLDPYNGVIVAYETATLPAFAMVARMIKKAFRKLGADDRPVVHFNQGSEESFHGSVIVAVALA